uniref:DOMON domain-containing protein n=1 Tax=Bursaphelenchus xylophilus TaxID=6326 RepID=A0A1I7S2N2_BURXY
MDTQLLVILIFAYFVTAVRAGNQIYARLKHHEILVNWKVDWESQEIEFDLAVRGKPFKWLGFGFSDHGKWEGSDLCVWKRGERYLKDEDWEHVPRPETFAGSYERRRAAMECPAINR